MDWFKVIYTVLGGLGLFFFGMKLLSESLQASGSDLIRKVIQKLTKNRIVAVGVGLTITCIVQSSSITTVMIVGFVNAGLMELGQALGIILGANIGTTITGWMISIKVGKYSLLFVGLGALPFLLAKREKVATFGKLLFAVGLVFLGLNTMGVAFKPLRTDADFLSLMTYFTADNYLSLWATVLVGCFLTFAVQSSSAMLGITIALASSGAISFQTALALVMGENIGTTITAFLASVGTNVSARRAGLAHGIFNVLGVLVLTTFFWVYQEFIESLIPGLATFKLPDGTQPNVAAHIAAGHTIFNVANVIVFLPFLPLLQRLVVWMIPDSKEKEIKHLDFFGDNLTISPAMALEQAYLEVVKLGGLTQVALECTKEYIAKSESNRELAEKVLKYEAISDNMQKEVVLFLGKVMGSSLTEDESSGVQSLLRMADEYESILDYCESIVHYGERVYNKSLTLDKETKDEMLHLCDEVEHLFLRVHEKIEAHEDLEFAVYDKNRELVNNLADQLKKHHVIRVGEGKLPALASLTLSDIIVSLRRIKNHSVNLAEAYMGGKAHIKTKEN